MAEVFKALLAETHIAKEARRMPNCRGNLLDCSMVKYLEDCSAD
ncbi:MAG: hypothetical protein AB2417_01375 [Clostridiaceae bacterium]